MFQFIFQFLQKSFFRSDLESFCVAVMRIDHTTMKISKLLGNFQLVFFLNKCFQTVRNKKKFS